MKVVRSGLSTECDQQAAVDCCQTLLGVDLDARRDVEGTDHSLVGPGKIVSEMWSRHREVLSCGDRGCDSVISPTSRPTLSVVGGR